MPAIRRGRAALVAIVLSIAVAIASTLVMAAFAAPASAAGDGRVTDYGFAGRAYGTRAEAEALGAESARTVPAYLACTRRTGVNRTNALAETGSGTGAALTLEGVDNRAWSYRSRKQVGTRSRSKVANAVLGDPDGPHIGIRALVTNSRAFASRRTGKLGVRSNFSAGRVILRTGTPLDEVGGGLGGLLGEIGAQPGNELEIPGLGVLSLGSKRNVVRRSRANSNAIALKALLFGADTRRGGGDDISVKLGKSRSTIYRDQRAGVFRGKGVPLEANLLGDLVRIGRVNDLPLPCPGTAGKVNRAATADLDPVNAGLVDVGALEARTYGLPRRDRSARAWTESSVTSLDLGGQIELTAIKGRANVATNRAGKITKRSIRGSEIGSLRINGDRQAIPDPGQSIEVPGVARLDFFLTERSKRGLKTTAVRVTLLDGSGAEIDLGSAQTFIRRS